MRLEKVVKRPKNNFQRVCEGLFAIIQIRKFVNGPYLTKFDYT